MTENGIKQDDGKLRFDLIPPYALMLVAEAYTLGVPKYGDRNWERGIKWGRIFAAMMRHAWKWWSGEQRDPEGQHHLASVVFHCLTLMEYERMHPELDDRNLDGLSIEGGKDENGKDESAMRLREGARRRGRTRSGR